MADKGGKGAAKPEEKKADKGKGKEEKKDDKKGEKVEVQDAKASVSIWNTMPTKVVVHPIPLLGVVDHYNRVARKTTMRVVGILLGERQGNQLDITNYYAVPFEEDQKDPTTWFLDHNYHEQMYAMFSKVNAKEKIVGWYSSGPKLRPADLEINELIRRYTPNPVLVIIDVNPKDDLEIPTEAYCSIENHPEKQGTEGTRRKFVHIPSQVGAFEAEEVGVEHLLRDIRDITGSTVTDRVNEKVSSLKGLKKRMQGMHDYLSNVAEGRLPPNNEILYNMQDMFNLSPNLKVEELVKAFAVKTNDNMAVIYLGALVRSILALHELIINKKMNKEQEVKEKTQEKKKKEDEEKKKKEDEEKKSKEEADAKGKADGKAAAADKAAEKEDAGKKADDSSSAKK